MTQNDPDGVFVRDLNLRPALEALCRDGVVVVDRTLTESFQERLEHEAKTVPYEPAPREVGPVRQEIEEFIAGDLDPFPAVADLTRELATLVRQHGRGICGLASWTPNEIHLQRYPPGSLGITSHRDGRRYRRLVAVLSVRGRASLTVLRARHGEIVRRFLLEPGSLVLLRAPGLARARDGRPFHVVAPLGAQERLTVGLRMNAHY